MPTNVSAQKTGPNKPGSQSLPSKPLASRVVAVALALAALFHCVKAAPSQLKLEVPALSFIGNMVHDNPGEPPFVTRYNDPAWLKSQGWNVQIVKTFPQCAITWDAFDPAVMPPGSKERAFAEDLAKSIDARIAAAKKAGMTVLIFTDFLVVPKTLLAKYRTEMTIEDTAKPGDKPGAAPRRRISILQPMTQKVVREQVDEIFKRFPDLDGIVLRFGETYLHDTPFHSGGSPVKSVEENRALISLLRDELCVKRSKRLVYRTWDFGDGFHRNPDYYLKVTDAIEPHPLLFFSIKHTAGDYCRNLPFNPTLGIGRHRQVVEVSVNQAGLYGKCAWPYYCAKGVIEGWDNFGDGKGIAGLVGKSQFAGLWTWSHGDGWAGPYKNNEFWTDINAAVIRDFALHPSQSEQALFEAHCRDALHLDQRQTKVLHELLLLATDATYHAQESNLVLDANGHFASSSWWCRDEYLTVPSVTAFTKNKLTEKALTEKAAAVEDWRRVERMAVDLRLADPATQEFVEVSSTYGRIRAEICCQIWTMSLLEAQARLAGTKVDQAAMKAALLAYDAGWKEWRALKAAHACCPTLYRDDKAVNCGPPFATLLPKYRQLAGGE